MIIEHKENISSDFQGTIIDIETIGNFSNNYPPNDSRRYKDIKQVIFGYINKECLHILCAAGTEAIDALKARIKETIDSLEKPLYAFNCDFERGVLFHHLNIELHFDGELNAEKYERKADVIRYLDIDNYDDPFYDNGKLCLIAWERGEFDKAIAHNRACLLKEKDILVKRNFRKPDELILIKN